MSATLFHQIGPYEIQKRIGRGGIGHVFLAKDTRAGGSVVALKVVEDGPGTDARETAAAEQRGAELQRTFLQTSEFVPRVYDVGHSAGYLYIAMEYLEGEDLSALIQQGPIDPRRAALIAIQLCQFLEEVDRLEINTDGASPWTLLHNDLKPDNVRLTADDRVKVLDFGAAKPLSMSRNATRNDFYSTPYLSPECLDTGERDRQTDAWAVGAILYEMVAGRRPFRADSTRRLEERIRSRRPPDPLEGAPTSLRAIVAKLLAPYPRDRYDNAAAIREDLDRFLSAQPTVAEGEGWPEKVADEPPTRRLRASPADEPVTRATPRVAPASGASSSPTLPPAAAAPALPQPQKPRAGRRWIRAAILIAGLAFILNEGCVGAQARRVAATLPTREFADLASVWTEYDALSGHSWLAGLGVRGLGDAIAGQTLILAERVADSYRTAAPTVWSAQWTEAATALARATTVAPADQRIRGTMRYAEGHLHRIDGEARKRERQAAQAEQEFAKALTAFREAAALRPDWPDPFLGLARTFIYGIEDIDRGADAMSQAQKLGHTLGPRETAQLAYGYGARGATLTRAAAALRGMPQEREVLTRAEEAYRRALDLYATIATFADVPDQMRQTQTRLQAVERKLTELDLVQ